MAWTHKPKLTAAAKRDLRIARLVCRVLRAAGWADVALHDIRDAAGARLHPANLRCGQCFIACRSLSAPLGADLQALEAAGGYVQLGSRDLDGLLSYLARSYQQ